MQRVLLTAFEPYAGWEENASWLALQQFARQMPRQPQITTRRYPVDFSLLRQRLEEDLADDFDVALHLGQAPGQEQLCLEAVALNIARPREDGQGEEFPLAEDGALAYRCRLPLAAWAVDLCREGIPARVSYHAGTYICNAALYLGHYLAEKRGLRTRTALLHIPLDVTQMAASRHRYPSMPAAITARAVRRLIDRMQHDRDAA